MAKKPGRKKPTSGDEKKEAELLAALDRVSIFVAPEDEELDLTALEDRLEQSCHLYTQGGAKSREGMRLALRSTIAYLRTELPAPGGVIDRLLHPLEQLESALAALEEGMIHNSLDCAKRAGGSKLTKDEAEFRLMICVCVTLLIQKGRSPDEACRYVADGLKGSGFFKIRRDRGGNLKPISDATIKGWHSSPDAIREKALGDRLLKLETWFMRKAMSPFGLHSMQLTERPDAVVDHVLQQVLPLSFGHLRAERK